MNRNMRKLLAAATIALTFTGCANPAPTLDYYNSNNVCLLGETYYDNTFGMDIVCWNSAWEDVREGLCYDPLCDHNSEDELCPSSTNLWLKTVITDGHKLYMNALNPLLTDETGTMYRQIFSLNPDGSAFTLLHTYDATGNSSPYMQYADGYLYFQQEVGS